MIYTEHKITLDIHETMSSVSLSVKQGDTGRRLLINLTERGRPCHISEDCYAVFTAKKPDGKVVFNNCSIHKCVIVYDLTEQTVAVEGLVECEIILYGSNGKQLTSACFNIIVEDTIYDTETEIESTDEYNALADLIGKTQKLFSYGPVAQAIVQDAEGALISMTGASNQAMQGLRIFGKSIQNGTPTPDSPAEIVSVETPVVTVTDGTDVQTMPIPYTLPGIPVTSGGNYIEPNGQQWICDEVDFTRGVYVQRVYRGSASAFNKGGYGEIGSHARTALEIPTIYQSIATPNGLCNIMPLLGNYSADQLHFYAQNKQVWVFVPIDELEEKTLEGIHTWLNSRGAEFQYILATPIETKLTDAQIAAYAALHTYKPNTTIFNDAGAYMAAEYVADTKTYIERGISGSAATIGEVTLLASGWVGTASPYSQVVKIDGVTEYSQVDLTPTVEQLSVFYYKDLAFVTENDGGVVTVYAIGQKPENDYTIQVTITEVYV